MKSKSPIIVVLMLLCVGAVFAADISFTVTISDANGQAANLISDFAMATGWTANIADEMGKTIPNPETKAQHSKRKIQEHVKEIVKAYRANKKAEDARMKEIIDAETSIIFK